MNLIPLILIPLCALLNRGRGSHFWNVLPSTVASRLLMAVIAGLAVAALTGQIILCPVMIAGLMLWCTPGWDAYWSAEIGNDPVHSKMWGFARMCAHGLLLYPLFAALGYFGYHAGYLVGAFSVLQGTPYLVFGTSNKTKGEAIPRSEYTWGACIGAMLAGVLMMQ